MRGWHRQLPIAQRARRRRAHGALAAHPTSAYALGDANASNFRLLNHFLEINRAQSTAQVDAIERR